MKEIEMIYGIDVDAVTRNLSSLGAKLKKDVLQRNVQYYNGYSKQRKLSVRVRYEQPIPSLRAVAETAVFTVKSARRIVNNHKVQDEHETPVDGPSMEAALRELGLRIKGTAEMKRTYYELYDVSIEICRLPRVPAYLELEGTPEGIKRVAHVLGFSAKDYDNTPPRTKFKIPRSRTKWVF